MPKRWKSDRAREKAIVWASFNTGWKWITDRVVQSDLEFEVRKYSMTIENNELVFVKDRWISQCAIQNRKMKREKETRKTTANLHKALIIYARAHYSFRNKKVDVHIQSVFMLQIFTPKMIGCTIVLSHTFFILVQNVDFPCIFRFITLLIDHFPLNFD